MPVSSLPEFHDGPSLGRIRAALVQHRRRLDESERAFRQWQARWWLRERVIEQQIRRVQLQLAGLPVRLSAARVPPRRIHPPRAGPAIVVARTGLAVVGEDKPG
jgi:hypothetical protein